MPATNDLEKEAASLLIQWQITDLIAEEEVRFGVMAEFFDQGMVRFGSNQWLIMSVAVVNKVRMAF